MGLKTHRLMFAYYNPLDKQCKSVTGAIKKGEDCTFRVKTDAKTCSLILQKDGGRPSSFLMKRIKDGFELTFTSQAVGLYFYGFDLGDNQFLGLGDDYTGHVFYEKKYFQLSIYDPAYETPNYIKGGLIYQIFPDRFAIDGEVKKLPNRIYHDDLKDTPYFLPNAKGKVLNNDFFGGNLKGIISKLDYLKSLSVSVIYLNPIFKANSNHRYDTGDYMCIDENLGTLDDLKLLIKTADKYGIKIILDGVFSHTGDDSRYFNKYGNYESIGAYQSKESPYYEWYHFWQYPDKYESWWGIDILPEVNEKNPAYDNFINGIGGVIEHYTSLGLGGWRLDVADELPTQFLINLRNAVKRINKDAIVIGEVWEDATNKVSYNERRSYFSGNQLDSIMNYVLKGAIIDYVKNGNVKRLSYAIKEQIDHYPECALHSLMNILGTHDTYRIITSIAGQDMTGRSKSDMSTKLLSAKQYALGVERLKTASLLQYTIYGVPSIYYGDEIGMQGYSDPLNRKFFGANGVDEDLLTWYKNLGKIRSSISAFKTGELKELFNENGAYVFERRDENSVVTIGTNYGYSVIVINFEGVLYDLLTGKKYSKKLELRPGERCLLYKELI